MNQLRSKGRLSTATHPRLSTVINLLPNTIDRTAAINTVGDAYRSPSQRVAHAPARLAGAERNHAPQWDHQDAIA